MVVGVQFSKRGQGRGILVRRGTLAAFTVEGLDEGKDSEQYHSAINETKEPIMVEPFSRMADVVWIKDGYERIWALGAHDMCPRTRECRYSMPRRYLVDGNLRASRTRTRIDRGSV